MSTHSPFYSTAREINPDGGTHAISADPCEKAAAERATRSSWRKFPYYGHRYGERGHRFSLSDSGWIATLCALPRASAEQQILWLANLLAARGMPRYLMECHLEFLHAEIGTCSAQSTAAYNTLLHCASFLRVLREQQMPLQTLEHLAAQFETTAGNETGAVRNMGAVLVAAAIDERSGVEHAVKHVTDWACDPNRFSSAWIAAVNGTVQAARNRMNGTARI